MIRIYYTPRPLSKLPPDNCNTLLNKIEARLVARNISSKFIKQDLLRIKERCSDKNCQLCSPENSEILLDELYLLI